jgi:putative transposase
VTARGTERRAIFGNERCHGHFLELLEGMVDRYRVNVHAYVLMPNHVHLVLSTPEANLSAAMQWLKTSYSMWFNRKHERVGPLFQGRFKAELFEGRAEAWPITRYVHLNPVRVKGLGLDKTAGRREAVGLVVAPEELVRRRRNALRTFRWSSYGYYAGFRPKPEWLRVDEVLYGRRARQGKEQERAYREYVESLLGAPVVENPLKEALGGLLMGSTEWVRRMQQRLRGDRREQPAYRILRPRPDWDSVRAAVEKVRGERWGNFAERHGDWGRDLALYVLRSRGGLTLKAAAECVGIGHYQTAAQAIVRFDRRLEKDKRLRERLQEVITCIKIKT